MVALCRPGLAACYHGVWLFTSELLIPLWWFPPILFFTQLSATDVSARTTMKGAAKCDKHCELQNSVNQQVLERILRFRDIPESMPASVSTLSHSHPVFIGVSFCAPRRTCARDAFSVSSSNAMTFDCAHFVFSICQSDWCWLYSRSGVQSKT